jgi:hypothetical protein
MAVHDWTTIFAGGFHHFHQAWVLRISDQLNGGVLPDGYFAAVEQSSGGPYPDVVALEQDVREPGTSEEFETADLRRQGGIAVDDAPPRVRFSFDSEVEQYAEKADRIAIRSLDQNRIIAVVEVVSPGNKHSGLAFGKFREKVHYLIRQGIQILILDLFPPGKFDPEGLARGLQIESESIVPAVTTDEPLSFISLRVSDHISGFVELGAVGRDVPTMPMFLSGERYVNLPLNDSYSQAWQGVPAPWKEIVEGRRQTRG